MLYILQARATEEEEERLKGHQNTSTSIVVCTRNTKLQWNERTDAPENKVS